MTSTIILLTGANSGVGFAASKVLASASASFHIIMVCRSVEKAEAAKSEIEAAGITGALSALQLDVTDQHSIKEAAVAMEKQFGRVDVLINSAASGCLDPDVKTSFQLCMDTNVVGPAMIAAAFKPLLLKFQNPYSIYVSSGARTLLRNAHQTPPSHDGIRNGDAYMVSKAALNMLAVLDAKENGPKGLKVYAMSPGFVRSNLHGTSEEEKSGWSKAGDPMVSGELVLDIVQGKRDADVGCLMHKDGVYAW